MVDRRSRQNLVKPSIFSRFLSSLRFNKETAGESIIGYSKAALDDSEFANVDSTRFTKLEGKKDLEIIYRNSWPINRAINVRANLVTSRGFKIVTQSQKAEKVIETFLKSFSPVRPILALQNHFRQLSIDTDSFGSGYWERLFTPKGAVEETAKDFVGIRQLHPIYMDFERSFDGKILIDKETQLPKGYTFKKDDYKSIRIPLGRVAQFSYNKVGDELTGISTIEPVYKTAERLMRIEEGTALGIEAHSIPLHDVIVGDETHPPTKEMIDETLKEVKGLSFKSEYVHPPWIRVSQIEAFSLAKIPILMQPFITAIAASTGVPEFILLGRGEGTNKATAQAMARFVNQTIQPLQNKMGMFFEEEILAPLMKLHGIDEQPFIEWNEIIPTDRSSAATILKDLAPIMLQEKPLLSHEEAREIMGFGESAEFKKKEVKSIDADSAKKQGELRPDRTKRQSAL